MLHPAACPEAAHGVEVCSAALRAAAAAVEAGAALPEPSRTLQPRPDTPLVLRSSLMVSRESSARVLQAGQAFSDPLGWLLLCTGGNAEPLPHTTCLPVFLLLTFPGPLLRRPAAAHGALAAVPPGARRRPAQHPSGGLGQAV